MRESYTNREEPDPNYSGYFDSDDDMEEELVWSFQNSLMDGLEVLWITLDGMSLQRRNQKRGYDLIAIRWNTRDELFLRMSLLTFLSTKRFSGHIKLENHEENYIL